MKNQNLEFHHIALTRGYISVKALGGVKRAYKGRFGEGIAVLSHNPKSTRYCFISYYVNKGE